MEMVRLAVLISGSNVTTHICVKYIHAPNENSFESLICGIATPLNLLFKSRIHITFHFSFDFLLDLQATKL